MDTARDMCRRLFIATFGCQMNEYDSTRMARLMQRENYALTPDMNRADLILINTCCIREKAEQKLYSFLGRLRKLKTRNPELVIGVTGCLAQQEGENLFLKAPHLDLVIGTHQIFNLPELAAEVNRTGVRRCAVNSDCQPLPVLDINGNRAPLSAYVTITQGCDNFCSYCVVPYVRGREYSRPTEDILNEIRNLLENGAREITLLGQNVNSYGRGLDPGLTFTELILKVAELPDLWRLRFTTSHPKDLSPELIRALAQVEPLCEHIHLPVQSGSNDVLKSMNRKYTREDYLDKIERLRAACPDIAITTDIIVGFPGETDRDFSLTMDLVEQVRFDGAFSFKYSDRAMTTARRLENKIDGQVKGERLSILQNRQKEITLDRNRSMVGKTYEVLAEGSSKRGSGQATGRTRTNKIVNFPSMGNMHGRLTKVLIEQAYANSLTGQMEVNER